MNRCPFLCHPGWSRPFRFSDLSPASHHPLFVIPSVPGFPTSPLSPATTYVVLRKENHTQLTEAATLDRRSGEAEGSAVRLESRRLRLQLAEHLQLGNVIEHDERGEDQQHYESCLVDPLLELLVQIATHHAFNQQQDNHPAIQNRNGKKIEDAQIKADDRHQADNRLPARLLNSQAGFPRNSDRPTQVLHCEPPRHHA